MDRPIGLFDSGFGGLTVMKEVARFLPRENLIYIGDTARLPYGNKSPETVLQYAFELAETLLEKNCKLLIIACNTACSHALEALSEALPIPVIGVIRPGFELLMKASPRKRVAVLATASTIGSGIYQSLIRESDREVEVYPVACPLFVPLIEEGFAETPAARLIAHQYLDPLKGKVDAALLGCTHYPLMRSLLQEVLGPEVTLVEPASACALEARQKLSDLGLLNPQMEKPYYEFIATDDPGKFCRLGEFFFGRDLQIEKNTHSCNYSVRPPLSLRGKK